MNDDHWVKELLDDAHLHEREDRLARFDAHLPCLLFELEQLPVGSLRFAFLSDACKDLLGIPRDLLYADPQLLLNRLTDEDHLALLEALERSSAQLKPINWEGRLRIDAWRDLKWINLRATPTRRADGVVCWTGVMTNISQAKRLRLQGVTVGSRRDQMEAVRAIEASGIKPVVDSHFPLEGLADAFRHLQAGKHIGKICIDI